MSYIDLGERRRRRTGIKVWTNPRTGITWYAVFWRGRKVGMYKSRAKARRVLKEYKTRRQRIRRKIIYRGFHVLLPPPHYTVPSQRGIKYKTFKTKRSAKAYIDKFLIKVKPPRRLTRKQTREIKRFFEIEKYLKEGIRTDRRNLKRINTILELRMSKEKRRDFLKRKRNCEIRIRNFSKYLKKYNRLRRKHRNVIRWLERRGLGELGIVPFVAIAIFLSSAAGLILAIGKIKQWWTNSKMEERKLDIDETIVSRKARAREDLKGGKISKEEYEATLTEIDREAETRKELITPPLPPEPPPKPPLVTTILGLKPEHLLMVAGGFLLLQYYIAKPPAPKPYRPRPTPPKPVEEE